MKKLFWRIWNWARGLGFYWTDDGVLEIKPGTCPYPTRDDWSSRTCVNAGDCGCSEYYKVKGIKP